MTVYVDTLKSYPKNLIGSYAIKYGFYWCHMWCDGDEEELHSIAEKIGLKRSYFQKRRIMNHYDLIPSKRQKAVKLGAVEISLKDWINKNHFNKSSKEG